MVHDLHGALANPRIVALDIKGFDGERKSLVYDNYNKLITATDTIRNVCQHFYNLTRFDLGFLMNLTAG